MKKGLSAIKEKSLRAKKMKKGLSAIKK